MEVTETVPASRKLQADDAKALLAEADTLVAMKGKKVERFDLGNKVTDDAVAAMLGPTGNLRAPTIRAGRTLLVGFNEDEFAAVFR
ncbi:MAG: ArsC family (seleno)protein [Pseudomonadota bacterium]